MPLVKIMFLIGSQAVRTARATRESSRGERREAGTNLPILLTLLLTATMDKVGSSTLPLTTAPEQPERPEPIAAGAFLFGFDDNDRLKTGRCPQVPGRPGETFP
jgi:hypothetical protein